MTLTDSPLGHAVATPSEYAPGILFPIARAANRTDLDVDSALPFNGVDVWNAFEVSWLDSRGKPQVAVARFVFPADSPNIVESKSFKLYLNSLNQTRLDTAKALQDQLAIDLSRAAGSPVQVDLVLPCRFDRLEMGELAGTCLDDLDVQIDTYAPSRELLQVSRNPARVCETLMSRLLKSNCPVTGQPDWGSVQIAYAGPGIDHHALLRYIISFRQHAEFHEHCVERMFMDILRCCEPEWLTVYARYTRRGGLDINPWRSNRRGAVPPADRRSARQ